MDASVAKMGLSECSLLISNLKVLIDPKTRCTDHAHASCLLIVVAFRANFFVPF